MVHGRPPRQDAPEEWSGGLCPTAPDTCWIDDKTGEHVNAVTGVRTPTHHSATPPPDARQVAEQIGALARKYFCGDMNYTSTFEEAVVYEILAPALSEATARLEAERDDLQAENMILREANSTIPDLIAQLSEARRQGWEDAAAVVDTLEEMSMDAVARVLRQRASEQTETPR